MAIFGRRPAPRGPREITLPIRRAPDESITCPRCGFQSYHPRDIEERYCGNCHAFHDDLVRPRDLDKISHVVELRTNLRALTYGEKIEMAEALSKIVDGKLTTEEIANALYRWTKLNGEEK